MRRRRLRMAALSAAATALAVVVSYLATPTASADVAGPYFATQGNASDPHITRCTDPATGHNGYCLYTSRDMGQQYAYPGNYYPMKDTYLYYSPNGYKDWVSKGVVASEATIYESYGGWVPDNAYHQWAPSAIKKGSYYYLYVPNVDDKSNQGVPPPISTTSRIGVWRSTSAFGPYNYYGRVSPVTGYMSDPEVYVESAFSYLIWADGDNSTCGGFKGAPLQSNMLDLGSVKTVTIDGIEVLGSCVPAGSSTGVGRPYMEGASLFKFNDPRMPGPYTLVFAAKPTSVPRECQSDVVPNGYNVTDNEVIAYATADLTGALNGEFTYQGIIMCGSETEWTNQATIAKINAAGNSLWEIIYHDAGTGSDAKQRNLHADCLFAGGGKIAGVYRQPINAQYGFNACTSDYAVDFSAFSVTDPQRPDMPTILSAPNGGAWDLRMNRYAVGPWERFEFVPYSHPTHGTVYGIQSLANGKWVCSPTPGAPLKATCQNPSYGGLFLKLGSSSGAFRLYAVDEQKLVDITSDGRLRATLPYSQLGSAAVFTEMSLT